MTIRRKLVIFGAILAVGLVLWFRTTGTTSTPDNLALIARPSVVVPVLKTIPVQAESLPSVKRLTALEKFGFSAEVHPISVKEGK